MSLSSRNITLGHILKYRMPIPAMVSILHRITGIIIFLMLPFAIWLLKHSLSSEVNFIEVKDFMKSPGVAFFIWLLLSVFIYHLLAGFRHILMDLGFFENLRSARVTSIIVLVMAIICAVLVGVCFYVN